MEKNTVETAENISRERKFQEDRLEEKKRMALELEKRDLNFQMILRKYKEFHQRQMNLK